MIRDLLAAMLVVLIAVMPIATPANGQSASDELFYVAGVDAPITIYFDAFGVPQISAQSSQDLFVGQGFVHAAQRWWQLEWSRHAAQGRLAALAGSDYIEQDRLMHTLGIPDLAEAEAERLSPDTRQALEAYARGINLWLEQQQAKGESPAWQYGMLADAFGDEIIIAPWTLHDTLSVQYWVGWRFNEFSLITEVLKDQVVQAAGPLAAVFVLPSYPYNVHPLTMEPAWQPNTPRSDAWTQVALEGVGEHPITLNSSGSNAWVVNGEHTLSGKPVLANDSHLGIAIPSLWYENGLHCVEVLAACPYRAYGFSIVGAPGVMVGHNQDITWGFTSAQTDLGDFFRLELNPEDMLEYRDGEAFRELDTQTISIAVRGGEAAQLDLQRTHFGPVFEQFEGIAFDDKLALYWAGFDGHRAIEGVLAINRAADWDTFRAGLAYFDISAFNAIYADRAGNIGYALTGRIPLRDATHDGSLHATWSDDSLAWRGYLDSAENPHRYNPPAGILYSANNAIIHPEDFPHYLAAFYDYGYRAARVGTLLAQDAPHSVASFQAIQLDQHNSAAVFMMPLLAELDIADPDTAALITWLAEWDFQDRADSPQAALFNTFLNEVVKLSLEELPAYEQSHMVYLLSQMVDLPLHPLWQSQDGGLSERDAILEAALLAADTQLTAQLGADRSRWRWGDLHPAIFQAEIVPILEANGIDAASLASATRETPLGGGLTSPNVAPWSPLNTSQRVISMASMRFIIDLADLDSAYFVNATGQSGDPTSPHFADQIALWAEGTYRTRDFGLADIQENAQLRWELQPR